MSNIFKLNFNVKIMTIDILSLLLWLEIVQVSKNKKGPLLGPFL